MIKPDVILRAADDLSAGLVKRRLCPKPFILPYHKEVAIILFWQRNLLSSLCVGVPVLIHLPEVYSPTYWQMLLSWKKVA